MGFTQLLRKCSEYSQKHFLECPPNWGGGGDWKYSLLNVEKVFTTVNCHFSVRNGAHVPWIAITTLFPMKVKVEAVQKVKHKYGQEGF